MTAGFLRLISEEMRRVPRKKASMKSDLAFIQQFYVGGSKRTLLLESLGLRSALAVHLTEYWHVGILANKLTV